MKKISILVLIFVSVLAVGITGFVIYNNREVFEGTFEKDERLYSLNVNRMNGSDQHTMELQEGDTLKVTFQLSNGSFDLAIGMDGEHAEYTGKDLSQGGFHVVVGKSGTYTVSVSAKHASGWIQISGEK